MKMLARLRREDDGAAAVEFALIVGVLAMLLFGMLQFGLAFFSLQNLRAAVREGARVGAVGASTAEIEQKVADASLDALPNSGVAIVENTTDGGSTWSAGECPDPEDQTEDTAVRVTVDLDDPDIPANLQNIFTVDVPLMPPIDLTDASITGQFRCEGV